MCLPIFSNSPIMCSYILRGIPITPAKRFCPFSSGTRSVFASYKIWNWRKVKHFVYRRQIVLTDCRLEDLSHSYPGMGTWPQKHIFRPSIVMPTEPKDEEQNADKLKIQVSWTKFITMLRFEENAQYPVLKTQKHSIWQEVRWSSHIRPCLHGDCER